MDKQAYHYNKKKLKGNTPDTFLYFYSCDPADNPNQWIGGKPYAVIEGTEREWEILFALDREEYNDNHAYTRRFSHLNYQDEDELTPEQREKWIDKKASFTEAVDDRIDKNRALQILNEQERQVYRYIHDNDMRQSEVAKRLGVTQGYVSMLLEQAEEEIAEYDGDKTQDGVVWRYWQTFVKKGYMPNHIDVEIKFVLGQLVCDLLPFLHWFYSISDFIRHITKFYLFDNEKMAGEIAEYLNAVDVEDRQHFKDYYGDQPEIIGAVYIRIVKEVHYRQRIGLHESDNIYTSFMSAAEKIAKRVHMTVEDFLTQRFYPYLAAKRKKSARQFYKLYTGKTLPKQQTEIK